MGSRTPSSLIIPGPCNSHLHQATLREIEGGAFRGGGYAAQHTGYSTQYTGYSAQATGAGGYPPGPPPPSGARAARCSCRETGDNGSGRGV